MKKIFLENWHFVTKINPRYPQSTSC